ncbi:hypothetical protein QTN47_07020 [Danxiaibacter flavus]|uniref:Uncharacterized protein n=1 Tax=Danxiaibacter flavus TaxID=3049108 RepID=A0ABV3ZDH3_9BACT|nr:hypothetical protein QNM32_07020 [Chitinophagaceae bacterium DXS]
MITVMDKVSVASVEDFNKLVNIISQVGLFSGESNKQLLPKKKIAEWLQQFVDIDDSSKPFTDTIYEVSHKPDTGLQHIHDFTKQHMEYGDSDFDDLRMK